MNEIKFAVIQAGYCVFGVGETPEEAIMDAAQWMVDDYGTQGGLTAEQVEDLIDSYDGFCGDFNLIDADDEEFDSYLENQGGFTKTNDGWLSA